ncbi:MAG: hypothetical protein NVS3B25_24610 [Hymenobacter sp.]
MAGAFVPMTQPTHSLLGERMTEQQKQTLLISHQQAAAEAPATVALSIRRLENRIELLHEKVRWVSDPATKSRLVEERLTIEDLLEARQQWPVRLLTVIAYLQRTDAGLVCLDRIRAMYRGYSEEYPLLT